MSHNPKVCFSLFPNLDFELLMGLWVFLEPHELFMVFFFLLYFGFLMGFD